MLSDVDKKLIKNSLWVIVIIVGIALCGHALQPNQAIQTYSPAGSLNMLYMTLALITLSVLVALVKKMNERKIALTMSILLVLLGIRGICQLAAFFFLNLSLIGYLIVSVLAFFYMLSIMAIWERKSFGYGIVILISGMDMSYSIISRFDASMLAGILLMDTAMLILAAYEWNNLGKK